MQIAQRARLQAGARAADGVQILFQGLVVLAVDGRRLIQPGLQLGEGQRLRQPFQGQGHRRQVHDVKLMVDQAGPPVEAVQAVHDIGYRSRHRRHGLMALLGQHHRPVELGQHLRQRLHLGQVLHDQIAGARPGGQVGVAREETLQGLGQVAVARHGLGQHVRRAFLDDQPQRVARGRERRAALVG